MPNSITRRASLSTAPSTWNEEARSIDVVFSTFADVQRPGYLERVTQGGLDLSRLIGAHVLKDHNASSIDNVLGVVVAARRDGTATLRLSDRPEVAAIVSDIAKGVIRHLSFSANVSQWRESTDPKSGARIKTAVRWTPHELSFVAVPADPGATTRGAIIMEPELENAPENPANETVTRNQAIRSLCRANGMTQAFTDTLIDAEGDLIAARAAVNAEIIRRAPVIRATVGVDHTDPAALMQRQIGGFVASATGVAPKDDEREYAGLHTMQHLREMLERRGIATRRMNDHDVIGRAFGTGDAPEFFTGVGNRVALGAYARARSEIMDLTVLRTVSDYRPVAFLRDGDFEGGLEEVSENGEFTRTSFGESKVTTQVRDFARGFDITERALRNDDKGVTTRIPEKFGAMAAAKDAELVAGIITSNPLVDDGHNLFDEANHDNYAPGDTPINEFSVSSGRLAMRSLKGLDGDTLLDIRPRFLVVGKALETAAEKFLASITATTTPDVNPFAGKLQLIVEPRIGDYQWLMAADPAQAPVLAIIRLAGQEAPRIEQETMWNTFGVSYRCKHTVNAAAIGWRGLALWANGQDSNSEV